MGRRRSVLRAVRFPQGDGAPVRPTFLPFRGGEVKRPLPSGEGGQGGRGGASSASPAGARQVRRPVGSARRAAMTGLVAQRLQIEDLGHFKAGRYYPLAIGSHHGAHANTGREVPHAAMQLGDE